MTPKTKYFIKWLKKYGKTKIVDIRCGIWSGFPLCCVIWYVLVWEPLYSIAIKQWSPNRLKMAVDAPWWRKHVKQRYDRFEEQCLKINPRNFKPIFWQRVPCPWCALMNKPIKPKNCKMHKLCQGKK